MTRLITDGFELQYLWEERKVNEFGTQAIISSSVVRSGAVAMRCGDVYNYGCYYYFPFEDTNEIYLRYAFYNTSAYNPCNCAYLALDSATSLVKFWAPENKSVPNNLYIGSSLVASGNWVLGPNEWHLVQIHAIIDDSTGLIEIKADGRNYLTYSGDTKSSAVSANVNRFYLGSTKLNYVYFDDVGINDTNGESDNSWVEDGHIIALTPNAAGSSNDFTPTSGSQINNYQMVDESVRDNDTTYVESSTPDHKDLYSFSDCGIDAEENDISRVWISLFVTDTTTGSGIIKPLILLDEVETELSEMALSLAYTEENSEEVLLSPSTSLPWTPDELDALEAGIKVVQ